MHHRFTYLIKNTGILTISNFSSKFLVFLLVPLYTNCLSTSEYGTYDLIMSTLYLLYPVLSLNILDAVMRFLMDKSVTRRNVISLGGKYIGISIIIVSLFLLLNQIIQVSEVVSRYAVYIGIYYIFFVLYQFLYHIAKGLERINEMAIAGVISTVSMLVLNIVFLLLMSLGLMGFFLANAIAQFLPVLYLSIRLKPWSVWKGHTKDPVLEKEMLLYCVPLIVTAVSWWVNNTADKYIVTLFCGIAANGLLAVAYKIPTIINTFQSIFIQAWTISAIKEYGKTDSHDFYLKTFSVLNCTMSFASSVLISFTRPCHRRSKINHDRRRKNGHLAPK